MKLQPLQVYKFKQVLRITLMWVFIGVVLELHNAINYNPETGNYFFYPHFGETMLEHLLITAVGPLMGGILFGSLIIFYLREKLKTSSYSKKLLTHSVIYIVAVFICVATVGFIAALNDNTTNQFIEKLYAAIINLRVMRLMFDWYFIVIITIFLLDVSEKYGQGILRKTLLGKYHTARKEVRVFMFLDLKSSTTIAERIGEDAYFNMLKLFYSLANEAIVNSKGEIYQYVGDEVIVSWTEADAISEANGLNCFYKIKEAVTTASDEFNKRYGVTPDFKAAIHAGRVATGEIGLVKKDIVYSGDVLNATARMVALCNHYKADLLISDMLFEKLKTNSNYQFQYVDSPDLRGKQAKLGLYSVTKKITPSHNHK